MKYVSHTAATASVEEVGEFYARNINCKVRIDTGREIIETWGIAGAMRATGPVVGALGFVGRYRSGAKAWRASVSFSGQDFHRLYVDFGRDDRCGKFRKQNLISYAPDVFFSK